MNDTNSPLVVEPDSGPIVDMAFHQDEDNITLPTDSPESCEATTNVADPIPPRPHRSCGPPKRLIEEMD